MTFSNPTTEINLCEIIDVRIYFWFLFWFLNSNFTTNSHIIKSKIMFKELFFIRSRKKLFQTLGHAIGYFFIVAGIELKSWRRCGCWIPFNVIWVIECSALYELSNFQARRILWSPFCNLASLDWVFRCGHHINGVIQNGKSYILSQNISV